MNYKFVKTSDKETRKQLIDLNLHLLSDDGQYAIFVNEIEKINFSSINKNKLQYTNILHI